MERATNCDHENQQVATTVYCFCFACKTVDAKRMLEGKYSHMSILIADLEGFRRSRDDVIEMRKYKNGEARQREIDECRSCNYSSHTQFHIADLKVMGPTKTMSKRIQMDLLNMTELKKKSSSWTVTRAEDQQQN
ncbi:hypothetical protein Acr_00g0009060 [Actinidia rufa]|uniref:Uncharacterized protein n=1 Tax=Actinidia rufa TaxID=165716 RepID=A0A7J0D8U9_9ERIC|nr:hypothetical protein Acr_00g0009060 [Actinidia rufa]